MRQHRRPLARMLSLYALAAVMALIPAWVIGEITNFASDHQLTAPQDHSLRRACSSSRRSPTRCSPTSPVAAVTCWARPSLPSCARSSSKACSALPLAEVERAGTGDLLSRTTNDMEALSRTVRFAVPEWLVAILQAVLTLGAMLLVSPLASVASLVSLPVLFFSTRCYLRYATPGYRRERISYATMSGTVAETAEGARTIDAHRLGTAPGDAHRGQRPRVLLLRDVHAVDANGVVPHGRGRLRPRGRCDARLERMARHPHT